MYSSAVRTRSKLPACSRISAVVTFHQLTLSTAARRHISGASIAVVLGALTTVLCGFGELDFFEEGGGFLVQFSITPYISTMAYPAS